VNICAAADAAAGAVGTDMVRASREAAIRQILIETAPPKK